MGQLSRGTAVAHDENVVLDICRGQGFTPSYCVTFEQIEGSSSDRRILDSAKTCNSHLGSDGKKRCSSAGNRAPGRILDVGVNTTKEMPLPLCLSQVRCRLQDTTKRKQSRVSSSVLLFKRYLWVLKEVLRLEKRTPCGALLARTACARPPTRTIMKLRSTFSTGAALRATWTSQAARQPASSPFCALGRPEPQLQPKPRSGKVPQWKSHFSELSMFFKRYIPVCECAFLSFHFQSAKKLPDALS